MSGVLHGIMLGGFFKTLVETLIDRTLGTNIGDMTSSGNLAASFDGTTNQAPASCSSKTVAGSTGGFVGKDHGSGKIPSKVIVYGSNSGGYRNVDNTIVLDFRVSNSAPSAGSDGSSVGSISFTNLDSEATGRTITSSDTTNSYRYWWVRVTCTSDVSTDSLRIAEIQMYEMA